MPALQAWESLKDGDIFQAARSIPLTWIFGFILFLGIAPAVLRKIRGHRYEVVNPSPFWDIFDLTSMIDFVKNGTARVSEGFQKFNGRPFILNTDVKPKIILAPEYIDWVNACPDLDFLEFVKGEFLTHLPCFKFFDPPGHLVEDMVRTKLTQNLAKFTVPISDEAALSLDELWGNSKEWQTRTLKPDLLLLISRLSAVIFTGGELAHDEEWQRITIDVTVNGFIGVVECRSFPKPLQYLVSRIMPHAIKAGSNMARGQKKMHAIIERRQREEETAIRNGEKPKQYSDAIAWIAELAATGKYPDADPAIIQLSLAMAAIHTSTNLITEALYRLLAQPELIQPIREEAIEVIGTQGWTKQALQQLRLLDSMLKETQRLQPGSTLVMSRLANKDVELPGGVHIKKGEQMAISTHLMTSPNFYDNPTTFDPWRFAKRREDPKLASKSHLVSTSIDHTGFSHGKHSCPGRFFAANEIKIALVHLLLKYDIELIPGESTAAMQFGTVASTNDKARVRFRRRQEETQL